LNEKSKLKNRLKVARAELNLSQDQLALMAGVTRQTISSIETGQYCPTAKLALILSRCLNKKFEELFYLEEDGKNV
jgi:putative transcriptional regulator